MLSLFFVVLVLVTAKINVNEHIYGTNIHYTHGMAGESEELSEAYRIARMDFQWGGIERTKGQYDFSAYDNLYNELSRASHPVACYWILDYGNPLYDGGHPPITSDAIQAFVNFAVAGITHFKGRGIIWEMWNEPNGGFWYPVANATAYSILANAVGKAIRGNSGISSETYVGPATSGIDFKYIETTFQHGLLDYFDAVSVHPYRGGGPESVISEYNQLKTLIQKYAPGKDIPIISGEWGWSTCLPPCTPGWPAVISESVQANYIVRQWFINTLSQVPVSIYYDYVNDGSDPTQREDNFGTLRYGYHNTTLPFTHKPAFDAAAKFQTYLNGLTFNSRINSMPVDDGSYVLAFGTAQQPGKFYSVWKISGTPVEDCNAVSSPTDCGFSGITQQQCLAKGCCFKIPAPTNGPQCYFHASNTTGTMQFHPLAAGCFSVNNIYGNKVLDKICTDPSKGTLSLTTSDAPLYLIPL